MQAEVEGHEQRQEAERHEEERKQGAHYYDSIEPEEFEMPEVFEVEIRLADNQIKIVTV